MIARVRDVITGSTSSARIISVTGSTSANTGRAPTRDTDPAVAKNENVGVMTSSPGPIPSAISETSSASVPDDRPIANGTPTNAAISRSKASTSGPMMNCCEAQTRAIASSTSRRMEAYWRVRSRRGDFDQDSQFTIHNSEFSNSQRRTQEPMPEYAGTSSVSVFCHRASFCEL